MLVGWGSCAWQATSATVERRVREVITTDIDIQIARPAREVFAYISDFEKNPTWQNGMKSCTWVTPPPHGIGSRYEQQAGFAGRDINSLFEVLEFEPGRRVKATSVEGTFPITFTRWVEPIDGTTTRVRARIEGDSSGFFRFLEPLMAPMVRRSIRKDYGRLTALLEGSAEEGG
jgi:uncharacterized membrane protein